MSGRFLGLLLVLPALAVIAFLFILPLVMSAVGAFQVEGAFGWGNFEKTFDLYTKDIIFSVVIIAISTALIGLLSIAIGGYLTLGEHPVAVAILRWLYRWPMFIPFIVVGQVLRTFLSKSGMMNNVAINLGLIAPIDATSFLDWRGIVIAFVWKQTPFVALLVAGAMASLNRDTIEAARNLGASRLRVLIEIVVPQVKMTLTVGLILSFVTMMSVLSVPLMINAQTPTMLTADIAFRVNSYGDYGVANALGLISLVLASSVAWIYLRASLKERA
ncbi:ABC transporter permease [Neorhizobium alkalisoli]|uniref:Carbohydrate ABC transporter membrane protein 1 (CUT1 family) n=1 Tax=Neorhizobium alkalisoli TaxID=528178 RepID=A0A561QR47_9HYPH|nr:ABC transporter permease subunit [Neorhizobium alkalisoli]TWF52746.1 carbohydrate ABC transporter membrane protein 1 (CUT1 family) [Neorhizobium alkalisoli]